MLLTAIARLVLTGVFLGSCATAGMPSSVNMIATAGPPTPDSVNVEIFDASAPTRSYKEIAIILVGSGGEASRRNELVRRARQIGADAVVIRGRITAAGTAVPRGTGPIGPYQLHATAIRFLR